jgi:hypothetical protein
MANSPSISMQKRKAHLFVILLIVFSAFTADVMDLREELRLIPCPYNSLDNNITTGLISDAASETELFPMLLSIRQQSSVDISFRHLLPCGLRAPPFSS